MALTITTRSGSRYLVGHDDTVTRLSEVPVVGYDHRIVGEPMVAWEFPVVGCPWRYRTAAGPFCTTRVVSVVSDDVPLARPVLRMRPDLPVTIPN